MPENSLTETSEINLSNDKKFFDKWNGIFVVFSIFYFMPFFYIKFSALYVGIIFGIYAVFIGLFFRVMKYFNNPRGHENTISILIVALTLLSFFGTKFTPGTNSLFCFGAFFSTLLLNRTLSIYITSIIFIALLSSAYLFDRWHIVHLAPGLITTSILTIFGILEKNRRRHEYTEAKSQAQIEQLAKIAERERIARDLHDILGHTLSTISLKAQLANKLGKGGQTEAAVKEIGEVAEVASQALSEVRQAISGYKYKSINQHILSLVKQLEENNYEVHGEFEFPKINAKVESSLILILKEVVTNILRHSDGNCVNFNVETTSPENERLIISISDNGSLTQFKEGNGLSGIRERVEELGGEISIEAKQGMHFLLTISDFK